ncbi:MAG: helix-turn-helix transcriptional regulator [Lacrimispora sp.]|uniref:helix-turn-helix domain-containing protein n=1 Tax=Lacrimispora sp. TaxID=2719234 RepID=UPI0039E6BC62
MNKINYEEIGNRIRTIREAQGLTQEEASERCDITTPFYGNIERGDRKMSVETLVKISKGLGVSADELLFGDVLQKLDESSRILSGIQRRVDEKQFEKYLMIIKNIATIIDRL